MLEDAKILIIGHSGQIATSLREAAWPEGIVIDARGRDILDLTNSDLVLSTVASGGWSIVINAGAYTNVDRAEHEPELAFKLNRDGPAALAEACAEAGIPLIHLSSDYVFGGTKERPHEEEDAVAPLSVYGASKAAGEEALRARLKTHVILRTSWVFSAAGSNFVKTMLRLGADRSELRVVDDQSGCPTAASDIASAIMRIVAALLMEKRDGFGTFHFAGAGATTWYGFAREIFQQAEERGYAARPRLTAIASQDFPTPAVRPSNSVLDTTRIRDVYGIEARPWQDALSETLDVLLGPPDADRPPGWLPPGVLPA